MYFDFESFGEHLRHIRKSKKQSQYKIATDAEIDQSFYSLIERGRTGLSLHNFFRICIALQISPVAMLRQLINSGIVKYEHEC